MKLKISEEDSNFLCKIIRVDNLRQHSNAHSLQVTTISGNNVITGMDTKLGDVRLFFCTGSQIDKECLYNNNEFEDSTLNKNTSLKGYFKDKGQVRATKLRSEASMGYIVPCSFLSYMLSDKDIAELETKVGESFDTINETLLVQKYIPKKSKVPGEPNPKKEKVNKLEKLLVPNQLRFHSSTAHLGDNMFHIKPDDLIYVTYKIHGSSDIKAHVLVKRNLSFFEKLLKRLKVNVPTTEYGYIYSSGKPKSSLPRSIISKSNLDLFKHKGGFYKTNIWERAFNDDKDKLFKGLSVYSELAGFGTNGESIQSGYDYGCKGNEYKKFVYRITFTNIDGHVIEFNWDQIKAFCKTYGLTTVPELYYGKAKDLFPELEVAEYWNQNFLEKLKEKYLEKNCYMCKNKVPAEGIVLGKVDNSEGFKVYKYKSDSFCIRESKQLEEGILDMESEANAE